MLSELTSEGIVVTIVGAGVVFSFLTIMIFAMYIMSYIVSCLNKLFPEKVIAVPVKAANKCVLDDGIAVAILKAYLKK